MGKGQRVKAMKRTANKYIQNSVSEVCTEFFNTLCDMPFNRRINYASRIFFGKKPARELRGK